MKRRIHDALLGVFGLTGIAFFALSGASCEAPGVPCSVGHGPYFFKYQLTGGDASCYYGLTGEEIGISTYLTVVGREEVKDPVTGVVSTNATGADYNTRNIAIQSTSMGHEFHLREGVGTNPDDKPYAYGPLTSKPDATDLCYTGGASGSAALSAADLNVDAVDMDPAFHLRQEWKNVRFYVTASVPGTQVAGEMTFEDVTGGCTASYKFFGLYPAVFCGDEVLDQVDNDGDPMTPVENDTDDDEDPMTAVDNDDDDPSMPDEDEPELVGYTPNDIYCDPVGDPATGRLGSGINPDFQTQCDTTDFYCVLKPGTELVQ